MEDSVYASQSGHEVGQAPIGCFKETKRTNGAIIIGLSGIVCARIEGNYENNTDVGPVVGRSDKKCSIKHFVGARSTRQHCATVMGSTNSNYTSAKL